MWDCLKERNGMSEVSIEIGNRIRYFRKSRKMTLEELAELICKSKATMSKYEIELTHQDNPMEKRVCRFLLHFEC